jgi:hypothetical protein
MQSSSSVLILRGGIPNPVVVDLPLYYVDQVGHAAVVHVSNALIEPGVDLPVMLQGIEVQVLVAHGDGDVGGYLPFLYERQEVVEF